MPMKTSYIDEIKQAIVMLKNRNGSTYQEILEPLSTVYDLDAKDKRLMKLALKRAVLTGELKLQQGSYKVSEQPVEVAVYHVTWKNRETGTAKSAEKSKESSRINDSKSIIDDRHVQADREAVQDGGTVAVDDDVDENSTRSHNGRHSSSAQIKLRGHAKPIRRSLRFQDLQSKESN